MKTLLVNASPKRKDSASGCLLEIVQAELKVPAEQIGLHTEHVPPEALEKFGAADQWVFFFPLYVDALPSHLLSCLVELAAQAEELGPAAVYGVVNGGFYEGEQTRYALEVLSNWAGSCGFRFGGGVGIGGGVASRSLPAKPSGPMGPIVQELTALAGRLGRSGSAAEVKYATVAMPRLLYKIAGEASWRHEIRQNGGRRRDLGRHRRAE